MSSVHAPLLLSSILLPLLPPESSTMSPEREAGLSNGSKSNVDQSDDSIYTAQLPDDAPIDVDEYDDSIQQPVASLGAQLIIQFRAAALKLPDTIALAAPIDDIARFAGDPEEELCGYDDPWEMVDQALNVLVGYGKGTVEVAGLI
jgi:hypothetical protein